MSKIILSRKGALFSLAAFILLGSVGFWILITPDNPLTRLFRAKISENDAQVLTGPYPTEEDFRILKLNNVSTVISLLDPRLPYEMVLLERERKTAAKYGMEFFNYPMASVFGQRFGEDYDKNSVEASQTAATAKGKVYLHCYLGMHRAKRVEELLRVKGTITGTYLIRQAERNEEARLLELAQKEYDSGRYQSAIDQLKKIKEPGIAARLLEGWANFRLGEIKNARAAFEALLNESDKISDARSGIAYCALREGDSASAESHFKIVLESNAKDPSALTGIGIACYRQSRLEEAARYLKESLEINPNNEEARDILSKISP